MNLFSPSYNKRQTNKGFTLFIALVVSGMLLAIGLSIGNIILKQIQLSSSGKESQVAFYAADSAAECALYWDRKDVDGSSVFDKAFGTSTPTPTYMHCGTGPDGNGTVYVEPKDVDPLSNSATTTFYVDFRDVNDSDYKACAKVEVSRSPTGTVIDSRGYNAPFAGDGVNSGTCDVTNNRTVERGLLLQY